jgi:Sporulation and spore germination/Immunoglobulin-like domain of bacterial spore germination
MAVVVGGLAVTVMVLSACASPSDTVSTSVTNPIAGGASGSIAAPPAPRGFKLYWTRDCPNPDTGRDGGQCRIGVGEFRPVPEGDLPQAALDSLLAGPNDAERADGLGTGIRSIAGLNDLKVEGDLATVDFNRYFETAQTRPQVAQVVYTLTQFPAIRRVQFLIDHDTNGATGVPPLDRAAVADLAPAILVESPTPHATVERRFKLSGTALTFEGTVAYRVTGPDSAVIAQGTVSTVGGGPAARGVLLAPITLPDPVGGPVRLVVFQPNQSEDGPKELTPVEIPLVVG